MELPTKEWQALFKKKKHLLTPTVDLNEYFTARELAGQPLRQIPLGEVALPTGEIVVRDPLVYLNRDNVPYWQKTPAGRFPLRACVIMDEDEGPQYAAVAVDFSSEEPVSYTEALIGHENLAELEKGEYFGFAVDSGLGAVLDAAALGPLADFQEAWQAANPEGNIYDDYFAGLFAESYERNPECQREGGDWLNWPIPGSGLNALMFQSGFGEGVYPVYFGFAASGRMARLTIQFIDIALEYGDEL